MRPCDYRCLAPRAPESGGRWPIDTKVVGYIVVTLKVRPDSETGQYVSECTELGVVSCGDSLDDALNSIKHAVIVHLNGLQAIGEQERVLKDLGIQLIPGSPPHRRTPRTAMVAVQVAEVVSLFEAPVIRAA